MRKHWSKADSYDDVVKRDAERFWSKVDKSPHPLGCWIWTAGRSVHGRGQYSPSTFKGVPIGEGRATVQAHVYAYILTHGSRPLGHGECRGPKGIVLAHKCDNGHNGCVNPHHLIPTSQAENSRDKWRAGTHQLAQQAKDRLFLSQIKKKMGIPQRASMAEIADEMGISEVDILREAIGLYERWILDRYNTKVSFDFDAMAIKVHGDKLKKKALR